MLLSKNFYSKCGQEYPYKCALSLGWQFFLFCVISTHVSAKTMPFWSACDLTKEGVFELLFQAKQRAHTYFRPCDWNEFCLQSRDFQRIEALYKKNHFGSRSFFRPEIPKKIHQIWLGPLPVEKKFQAWVDSWRRLHPDWEYKLWTNSDVVHFPIINRRAYEASSLYSQKADILRYEILYRCGGLYADIDTEAIESFDAVHKSGVTFYSALEMSGYVVGNAIFGAAPGSPVLKRVIDLIGQIDAEKFASVKKYEMFDRVNAVLATSGPMILTKAIKSFLATGLCGDIIIYPSRVLSPSSCRATPGVTLAIHYGNGFSSGGWVKQ